MEVVAAKGLMPKDGQGTTNAYCVLDYGGQRTRTRVKHKDLNPAWNEKFEFELLEFPDGGVTGDLEINVQNERKSSTGRRSSFLGKVDVPITTLPSRPEATRWYPLQKRGLFSVVKGDLGLRMWLDLGEPAKETSVKALVSRGETTKEARADRVPQAMADRVTVPAEDFAVKETNPDLGKAVDYRQHYDLVEEMLYLFIRVVRARNLMGKDNNGLSDPYVRITLGPIKAESRIIPNTLDPEWNQTFAIGRDKTQGGNVEVTVWDADKLSKDDFLGGFMLSLHEVPLRRPPESPVAPSWYNLESKTGKGRVRGDIFVAIWWGTQADEAFPDAWHSDTGGHAQFKSKVYLSPKLWYLRVNVIEAQDIGDRAMSEPFVRAEILPYQSLRTSRSAIRGGSPFWNEDLIFVAAEPFDNIISLYIEEAVAPGKAEVLGFTSIPLNSFERRVDGRPVATRWYTLDREGGRGGTFQPRLHLRLCWEGGYHVMDESANYVSDTRPTARQLWRPAVGVLEVGIHGANNLLPMKTTMDKRGSTDAYCVAKYGPKWIRTRTIFDSSNPRWNEQYTWEVFDPCTVITIGVFDNRRAVAGAPPQAMADLPIGKVRIRLSTLETDRVYTNAYPLLVVTPHGVKKMGEIELAVRFSSASALNLTAAYLQPQLPRMHFFYPLDPRLQEKLRVAAMNTVALRLLRAEPPLRQEVIHFMLGTDDERWSMRRSKANYYRIMGVLRGVLATMNWFSDICRWRNPATTVLVHFLYLILVWYPELLLPTLFLYLFFIGSWNYRFRARTPAFMDAKLSQGEYIGHLDELEEEFNVVPANNAQEVLKFRYERLRGVAGRIQNALGDLASVGEKVHSLLSWRDPRATGIFITFCLMAAIVLYVTPFQVIAVLLGVYILRHPRFRDPLPSLPLNLFKRLPSQADRIL